MKAVVKEYKHDYQWAQSDWDTAVTLYETAKDLAKGFNQTKTTGREIHIVDYSIQEVINQPDNTVRPKLNEYVLVEDYLEGNFYKFVSNTGWVRRGCHTDYPEMPAFTHWSWVYTQGQLMITDLQGVRYDDKIVLTDPCVHSLDRSCGATDISIVGMCLFFYRHECNSVCKALGITRKRPNQIALEAYVEKLKLSLQKSTTYITKKDYDEIKPSIKENVRKLVGFKFN